VKQFSRSRSNDEWFEGNIYAASPICAVVQEAEQRQNQLFGGVGRQPFLISYFLNYPGLPWPRDNATSAGVVKIKCQTK